MSARHPAVGVVGPGALIAGAIAMATTGLYRTGNRADQGRAAYMSYAAQPSLVSACWHGAQ